MEVFNAQHRLTFATSVLVTIPCSVGLDQLQLRPTVSVSDLQLSLTTASCDAFRVVTLPRLDVTLTTQISMPPGEVVRASADLEVVSEPLSIAYCHQLVSAAYSLSAPVRTLKR